MTGQSNLIMDVLEQCQNGQLIARLAKACEISEDDCRQCLVRLTPEFAKRIRERITDEETYEELVDVLDEEDQVEILDDPQEILSRDAIEDGEAILAILYGSLDKAQTAMHDVAAARIEDEAFERLMTIAGALTFAAMARRNQQYQMAVMDQPDEQPEASSGIISILISALVTGFMQGFREATRRKRRRRRKRSMLEQILGTGTKRKRRTKRSSRSRKRRRRKTPSLTDLIGDILD